MPQTANPGIRRGKTPCSSCKKRPITDCSKSYRSLTIIVKTAKQSTSSTAGQMKGCIRHVIPVFNSKTLTSHWASAAQVSIRYTEQGTLHSDLDLPVKVMSMKALPQKILHWYTKFTLKPTRYMTRFTVSKNIKEPPGTVCHSQRWMVNPVFSYRKHQVDKTPFCQRNHLSVV